MKKMLNIMLVISIMFLVATDAWALTIGNRVRMNVIPGEDHPYQLTDITDTYNTTTYISFCLERQQYFYNNGLYYVQSTGDYALNGGYGDLEYSENVLLGDPLANETRWLYAAFRSELFIEELNAAQMVQQAIWYLEGEYDNDKASNDYANALNAWNTLSNYNTNNTYNALGWDIIAVNISSNGLGTSDNQSQLIGVAPVPEPATMLLLGTGLIGLAGVGRKKFLK